MNKNAFMQFIASDRDCEEFKLDTAINKGLQRARNDKLDSKKIFLLAAACVFIFVMCLTVNLRPLKEAAEEYYQYRQKSMPGSSEVLDGYLNEIANNFKRFIGED